MDSIKKNKIEQAAMTDRDVQADVMAELLLDPKNSSYKMYEDLVAAYCSNSVSDDFRAGFDRACEILVANNMACIADIIIGK